jgi:hypothetical protein
MPNPIPLHRPRPIPARLTTHDGTIWNLKRAEMTDTGLMRERMAHDIQAMLRDRGPHAVITTDDFLRLGWTRGQIDRHRAAACRLIKADATPTAPKVSA